MDYSEARIHHNNKTMRTKIVSLIVTILLNIIIIIIKGTMLDVAMGKKPIANKPADATIHDNTYHFFKVIYVSTNGAHKNLATLTKVAVAESIAMDSIEIPTSPKRYPSAPETYPPPMPKGNTRNIYTIGCAYFFGGSFNTDVWSVIYICFLNYGSEQNYIK